MYQCCTDTKEMVHGIDGNYEMENTDLVENFLSFFLSFPFESRSSLSVLDVMIFVFS